MKRFVLVSFILGVLTLTQAASSPVSQAQEPLSPQLSQEDAALFSETWILDPKLSASFDIEGIDAVVIGRPNA